jgi:hypothetical protein
MRRQAYDLQLKQYPGGWRVNFRRRGGDQVMGTGWDPAPWRVTSPRKTTAAEN